MDFERNDFIKFVTGTVAFSLFLLISCICIFVFLPAESGDAVSENVVSEVQSQQKPEYDYETLFSDPELPEVVMDFSDRVDTGLVLYRQPQSRAAVEWYYSRITNSRETAQAILKSADENDIPLSLAFALAHTESRYKTNAVHKNTNGSVDRGLFQLNNNSFPKLNEGDFYDARTSAHYGLAHLRFCLNNAGNEIAALAMYNAGTNKVRRNSTPQITLNYISQIENYRSVLEENFATEVLALYNTEGQYKLLAKTNIRH